VNKGTAYHIYLDFNTLRDITADTALRLGRWFGTGPQLWLNLQYAYDLDVAQQQLGEALNMIEPRTPETVHA
jgi:antitoxin HigA-1